MTKSSSSSHRLSRLAEQSRDRGGRPQPSDERYRLDPHPPRAARHSARRYARRHGRMTSTVRDNSVIGMIHGRSRLHAVHHPAAAEKTVCSGNYSIAGPSEETCTSVEPFDVCASHASANTLLAGTASELNFDFRVVARHEQHAAQPLSECTSGNGCPHTCDRSLEALAAAKSVESAEQKCASTLGHSSGRAVISPPPPLPGQPQTRLQTLADTQPSQLPSSCHLASHRLPPPPPPNPPPPPPPLPHANATTSHCLGARQCERQSPRCIATVSTRSQPTHAADGNAAAERESEASQDPPALKQVAMEMASVLRDLRLPMQTLADGAAQAFGAHAADVADEKLRQGLERCASQVWRYLGSKRFLPRPFAEGMQFVFNREWLEVRHIVRSAILAELGPLPDFHEKTSEVASAPAPPRSRRAAVVGAFLYSRWPYDQSVWVMLRSVSWWSHVAASLLFACGVAPVYWLACLVLIERRDEFQLANFILVQRGSLAAAVGIGGLLAGAYADARCLAFSADIAAACAASGSGSSPLLVLDVAACLLQVATGWLAFALLPWTHALFAAPDHDSADRDAAEGTLPEKQPPTQRMRLFLLYEAACVVACTSIAIGTAREYGSALANWHTVWQVRMGAYWSMTLFGLLCVPYLVCCAPVVNVVVSQTTPTGYDRCGRCRWRLTVFQLETRRYIQQLSEDHDQHDDTPAEKKKHSGWMGSFDPRSMRIVRRFLPKRLL